MAIRSRPWRSGVHLHHPGDRPLQGLWLRRGRPAPGRVNPALEYLAPSGSVTHELAFRISRFRPVRPTSIDVFLEMLEPAGVYEVQAQALSPAAREGE
jgi:hypothetical protein